MKFRECLICNDVRGVFLKENQWGIVILHYKNIDNTLHCVDELLKKKESLRIVIVDNGSNDGSGEAISAKYKDCGSIKVIILKKNTGFARGNNAGYMYLKKAGCDFIVLLNNDAYVEQDDFFERLRDDYDKYGFAVCGPMVLDGGHNIVYRYPQKAVHTTVSSTYIGQLMCIVRIILSCFNLDVKLSDMISGKQQMHDNEYSTQYHEDVQISGCCIIFSREYIDLFDGLNEGTFLYLEEEILLVRARGSNLKTVYDPHVTITHIGEASTKNMICSDRKRRVFRYKNQLHSFKALRKEIKKYK